MKIKSNTTNNFQIDGVLSASLLTADAAFYDERL